METLINPNQIRDGGSSKEIKILNVVQTGTLQRDGAVFRGFSGNSNYLQLGARVDKGILSLDTSTYLKDLGGAIESANSWEVIMSFTYVTDTTHKQGIIGNAVDYGTHLSINTSEKLEMQLSNASSGSADIGVETGATTLVNGTKYWTKWEFTGSAYNLYLSTDGITYELEATKDSDAKINKRANWIIGIETPYRAFSGSIDIANAQIKINNELWWKGVETL